MDEPVRGRKSLSELESPASHGPHLSCWLFRSWENRALADGPLNAKEPAALEAGGTLPASGLSVNTPGVSSPVCVLWGGMSLEELFSFHMTQWAVTAVHVCFQDC